MNVAQPWRTSRRCGKRIELLIPLSSVLLSSTTFSQAPFPDQYIQDVTSAEDIHHYRLAQPIIAPGDPQEPTVISGSADAEFVSGTSVRLSEGFHAGSFSAGGQFHAYTDEGIGPADAVAIISPDPTAHIQDGVLHVNKWEKLELGVLLPQEYQDAIDGFFANYYSNGPEADATPNEVDALHDLNPYADDSLQLVMTLTKPSGERTLKWGFYMKEAEWESAEDFAMLVEATGSSLHPYNVRFRMAPDEEGPWAFSISIKAPHTHSRSEQPVPNVLYSPYSFVCDPPLPENKGHLSVNQNNKRMLTFEDGTHFFGMGTNMADKHGSAGETMFKLDYDNMSSTMADLHSVGGNFLRMYLLRELFAPEFVNLGVYDQYHYEPPSTCPYAGSFEGNGQFNCYAFDLLLEDAHSSNIYLQLCIDPYPPVLFGETYLWNAHPYKLNFLDPSRNPATGLYDLEDFFFTDASIDVPQYESGVFYFWKRRYKYILSRWGYSVNLAVLEPFNEIDQMLTYQHNDLRGHSDHNDICTVNQVEWPQDEELPNTLDSWLSNISDFVRSDVDINNPTASPLGEKNKLFLLSYTGTVPALDEQDQPNTDFYKPFTNPKLDLLDVHHYMYEHHHGLRAGHEVTNDFRDNYFSLDGFDQPQKKPFHHGEFNYFGPVDINPSPSVVSNVESGLIFGNYDVSFHNELWSSAFSGGFSTGLSWLWHRVFWWKGGLPAAPSDFENDYQPNGLFSSVLDDTNHLHVIDSDIPVPNKKVRHHFIQLSEFLANSNIAGLGIFDGEFTAHHVWNFSDKLEAYYLLSEDNTMAIGWVHNMNAFWPNNYYVKRLNQHFLDCVSPVQSIGLPNFQDGFEYHISYLPTRLNTTELPADGLDEDLDGTVTLDLDTPPESALNGVLNLHLDTLHSDYAFVIAPFSVKSRPASSQSTLANEQGLNFSIHPNPARDLAILRFVDDAPKEILVEDLAGRTIWSWHDVLDRTFDLPANRLAHGAYAVRVSDGRDQAVKKLLIH